MADTMRKKADAPINYAEQLNVIKDTDEGKAALGKISPGELMYAGVGATGGGLLGYLLNKLIGKKRSRAASIISTLMGAAAGGLGGYYLPSQMKGPEGFDGTKRDELRIGHLTLDDIAEKARQKVTEEGPTWVQRTLKGTADAIDDWGQPILVPGAAVWKGIKGFRNPDKTLLKPYDWFSRYGSRKMGKIKELVDMLNSRGNPSPGLVRKQLSLDGYRIIKSPAAGGGRKITGVAIPHSKVKTQNLFRRASHGMSSGLLSGVLTYAGTQAAQKGLEHMSRSAGTDSVLRYSEALAQTLRDKFNK